MEGIESLVNIIVNNGIGVVCVAYMIYFQLTTMKEIIVTMNKMCDRLENIEDTLGIKEKEKKEKKNNGNNKR